MCNQKEPLGIPRQARDCFLNGLVEIEFDIVEERNQAVLALVEVIKADTLSCSCELDLGVTR
jgi:hypothetical protein